MKYIDLTHKIQNNMNVYPGTPKISIKTLYNIDTDMYTEKSLHLTTHTGTHIDAPAHIYKNTKSLDSYPMSKFIGKAQIINIEGSYLPMIPLESISEIDLRKLDFVIFNTGHYRYYNDERYFENSPYLSDKLCLELCKYNIKAVGIDSLSIDSIDPPSLVSHKILLEKDILICENLTNLDSVNGIFELNIIPLLINNSDASPVRAFAKILK